MKSKKTNSERIVNQMEHWSFNKAERVPFRLLVLTARVCPWKSEPLPINLIYIDTISTAIHFSMRELAMFIVILYPFRKQFQAICRGYPFYL